MCLLFATIMNHQLTGSYWLSLKLLWITSLQSESADSLFKLRDHLKRDFSQFLHAVLSTRAFPCGSPCAWSQEQVETGKRLSATMKCDNDELIIRRQYFVFGGLLSSAERETRDSMFSKQTSGMNIKRRLECAFQRRRQDTRREIARNERMFRTRAA